MKDKTRETPPNPQVEKQLDALADLCWQKLEGQDCDLSSRSEPLLKALLMSGYIRQYGQNVAAELEKRVKKQDRQQAMHRGGALSSITEGLQKKFDHLVQWESTRPLDQSPPKAANISSGTDA